jgi:hypothetical protein
MPADILGIKENVLFGNYLAVRSICIQQQYFVPLIKQIHNAKQDEKRKYL